MLQWGWRSSVAKQIQPQLNYAITEKEFLAIVFLLLISLGLTPSVPLIVQLWETCRSNCVNFDQIYSKKY
jgi:hypothetical protein